MNQVLLEPQSQLVKVDRLGEILDLWQCKYGLTPAEAAVLRSATEDDARFASIASKRNVSLSTIKKQAQCIRKKLGACGLVDAALMLLRDLALGPREREC